MKKTKLFLIIFTSLILITSIFLFLNRDNFTYVGSVNIVEVDCSNKIEILNKVFESDQRIRRENKLIQNAKEDHHNQELVISIIEKCGMPSLKDVGQQQMNTVWLLLQHTDKKHRKKYFPEIEKAVKNKELSKEQYALMKDRILMDEGKPQLYGTQIKSGKLYKLESPSKVNERRQEMGMESIEDYLHNLNVSYHTH